MPAELPTPEVFHYMLIQLTKDVNAISAKLDHKYVTKEEMDAALTQLKLEYAPIKSIVNKVGNIIILAVFAALLALVLKKP